LAVSKKVYTFARRFPNEKNNMKNLMNNTTRTAALRAPHYSLFIIHYSFILPPPPPSSYPSVSYSIFSFFLRIAFSRETVLRASEKRPFIGRLGYADILWLYKSLFITTPLRPRGRNARLRGRNTRLWGRVARLWGRIARLWNHRIEIQFIYNYKKLQTVTNYKQF
jgi:hypothetical protein